MTLFIDTHASRLRPSDVGRPRTDAEEDEAVIIHFVRGLGAGLNLTQIAKGGLKLGGYVRDDRGKWQFKVRWISSATLLRRYSALKRHIDTELGHQAEWRPQSGMRQPALRCSFTSSQSPKRGRPKLNRRR